MGVFSSDYAAVRKPERGLSKVTYFFKRIGVSVLFAGAAVGVSHVVQSTRAGADFSLALLPIILGCLVLKYPAFMFGPLYTSVTGESVIKGYSRIGRWTLPVVAVSFVAVMATVVAAVSLLSAGILISTLNTSINFTLVALVLAGLCTALTLKFTFSKFHEAMKIVFAGLVVMSALSLLLAIPSVSTSSFSFKFDLSSITNSQIFFIAALVGWMPAGLDLPMMHSQWLLARQKNDSTDDNAIEDFNFGYFSTTILALLFLFIGAVFFFGQGIPMESSAGKFSNQLLGAYGSTLGSAGRIAIGFTLFLAIFSSLLVVVDGFPRVLSEVVSTFKGTDDRETSFSTYRSICAWLQFSGAALIILYFMGSLTGLVDFATATSFLLGPVFALLNHKIVKLPNFVESTKVATSHNIWSLVGLVFFTIFAFYYLYLKFI